SRCMDTALPSTPPSASPACSSLTRFDSIDLIRGVAVCGILLMNIVSFGMPAAAYLNPKAYQGDLLSSHIIYGATHVFADQKFMGLFSLLFGGGVMLFIQKLKARGAGCMRFHYSRMFWLLVFGLLHSLFLWEGDILFYYALCGFILYPLWRLPPAFQFGLGLAIFLSAILIDQMGHSFLESLPAFSLEALEPTWSPSEMDVAFETAMHLRDYSQQLVYRNPLPLAYSNPSMSYISDIYIAQGLARAFGLMLVGMAFYSWGVLSAQRSVAFYRLLTFTGLLFGLPVAAFGLWQNYLHDWDMTYGLFHGLLYNHLATPMIVFGYLGAIVWLHQEQYVSRLRAGLCAIGRMAFSNYIGQSLIATFIFHGYGLALFGQLTRLQLLVLVVAIWVLQFYFSLGWLRRFQYGPLEWLWRALTYCKAPRLRKLL
ncbi:MAG: DUF418 domain-containing protein, partial [Pirellulales bacterium]